MRCCGVSGVALGFEDSGVDVESVESLTPNIGDDVLGVADLVGVMNAVVDDFEEGRLGDLERGKSLLKAGGVRCASKFGLRGGMRARGDVGRGDGRAVACVGWVPLGVLMVRGRGTSCSRDVLLD
jgi:hypothetical protein